MLDLHVSNTSQITKCKIQQRCVWMHVQLAYIFTTSANVTAVAAFDERCGVTINSNGLLLLLLLLL